MNRLVAGRIIARSIGLLLVIVGLGFGSTQFNNRVNNQTHYSPDNSDEITVSEEAQTPQLVKVTSSSVMKAASNIISIPKAEAQTLVLPKGIKPHKLIIPKIKVAAPVRAMGLDGVKMAVLDNYTEIGWYNSEQRRESREAP